MSLPGAPAQRDFLGLSPALLWGYVAIALFMTGDGLEQAFLSDYLVTSLGYTHEQSGTLFTVYGLVVAIAAFASGVLAEYFGPRRIMAISTVAWISYAAPRNRLSSAMGWFWASYSIGVGVFGSYLPSLTIPWIGEVTTLWISIGFIALGGVLAAVLVSGRARSRASAARSARRSRCPSATRRSRSAWCSASSTRSPCTRSSS